MLHSEIGSDDVVRQIGGVIENLTDGHDERGHTPRVNRVHEEARSQPVATPVLAGTSHPQRAKEKTVGFQTASLPYLFRCCFFVT